MNMCYLLFIIFFFIFVIESGKIRPNFEEIFGNGWDKKENKEKVTKTEQNEQNDNSTAVDQMGEEMGNDPIDQTRNYINQNHSNSDQNITEEPNDQQKREIVKKFDAISEKLREKGKYENKKQSKIETKIAKLLGTNRKLIQKWKNELNLKKNKKMKKSFYEQKKCKFIERFNEFKELYGQGKQREFVKELGINGATFWKWKKKLLLNYHKSQKHYTNDEKLKKMKQYFEIKEANPKVNDEIIAKKLGIGFSTLQKWKRKCSHPLDQ